MASKPRAAIFDMDGTLTRPCLDFSRIREEIGVSRPILEAMNEAVGFLLDECCVDAADDAEKPIDAMV